MEKIYQLKQADLHWRYNFGQIVATKYARFIHETLKWWQMWQCARVAKAFGAFRI